MTTTHGCSRTRVYRAWHNMLARCKNTKLREYKYYGGRGIKVCKRWQKFENFLADMGHPPPGLSLDRINNNRGYYPSNCRWATATQQQQNRRRLGRPFLAKGVLNLCGTRG